MNQRIRLNNKNIPRAAKASVWFLFANVFQKGVMIIFTPIFTRILTTEEYSKYAVFQSWEAIFSVFATLGIYNYATAKALIEYKDDRDRYVSSAEGLTLILSVCVFGIYCVIRYVFGGLGGFPLWIMVLMFIDIITTAVFSFWSQMERFNQRYKLLVFVSIMMGIVSPCIAFALIRYSKHLGIYRGWSRIIGLAVVDGAVGLFLLILCMKKGACFFSAKYWRFSILYCIPLVPHFLATAFLQKIGQLFVDAYCGADASGVYSLGNTLAMLMMVVNDALTKTLVPWTYQKMSDEEYDTIHKPINFALILIAIVDVMMALLAPEILTIFASSSYAEAKYIVPPLVAVCFFGFLYNTYANIEYYFKETRFVSLASVSAGTIIVLLDFIFVPRCGLFAAAYVTLTSYVVYAVMHYLFMKKTLKKHLRGISIYNNRFIFSVTIVFLAVILLIPVLYKTTLIRYAIIMIAGVICWINRRRIYEFIRGKVI